MTRGTAWVGGTAVGCLLVVVLAWLLVIGPQRAAATSLRAQVGTTVEQNAALAARVQALGEQFDDLPTQEAELEQARASVPTDAELPTLVRQVADLAESAGVALDGIVPGEPVSAAAQAAADSAAAVPAPTATATATDQGAAAATADQATKGSAAGTGLVTVPVTVTASGGLAQAQAFLAGLQRDLPRAALVTGLTITPDEQSAGDVELSVSAEVLVLPSDDDGGSS